MLKSDVAAFEQYKFQFDDAIAKGKFDFAYQMFNLSLQRRAERFDYALSLLDKGFDFNANDAYEYEREDAPWPESQAQLDELWRQRVKFDALNLKLAGKKPEDDVEKWPFGRGRNIRLSAAAVGPGQQIPGRGQTFAQECVLLDADQQKARPDEYLLHL